MISSKGMDPYERVYRVHDGLNGATSMLSSH